MGRVVVAVVIAAMTCGLVPVLAGAATNPPDSAIVAAGLLTSNDFPPGWTQAPRPSSPQLDLSRYGKICAAFQRSRNAAAQLPTTQGTSPVFKQGTDRIDDKVSTHRTVAEATTGVAYLERPGYTACTQRYNTDRLAKASKNGVVYKTSNTRLSVPSVGDQAFGFENEVTSTSKGHTVTVYNEVEDVQVGRTNLFFSFTGLAASLLTNQQALVQSVVSRVRAAEEAT
jgi:hypothetical protein